MSAKEFWLMWREAPHGVSVVRDPEPHLEAYGVADRYFFSPEEIIRLLEAWAILEEMPTRVVKEAVEMLEFDPSERNLADARAAAHPCMWFQRG